MKALVGAFSQEKALVEAFSVIVKPMDCFTALVRNTTLLDTDWDLILAEVIRREHLQLEQLSISARLCFTKPSVNIVDIDVTIRVSRSEDNNHGIRSISLEDNRRDSNDRSMTASIVCEGRRTLVSMKGTRAKNLFLHAILSHCISVKTLHLEDSYIDETFLPFLVSRVGAVTLDNASKCLQEPKHLG